MKKVWLLLLVFFLVASTSTSAEIFRCRTADGQLVMTDQQDKLPADCTPVDKPADAGGFNVMPRSKDVAVKKPSVQPAQKSPAASNENFSDMQNEATELAQSYNDAVRRRYRASYTSDQRAAMREISELRNRKESMLDSLPRSGLTVDDQKTIRSILKEIPKN